MSTLVRYNLGEALLLFIMGLSFSLPVSKIYCKSTGATIRFMGGSHLLSSSSVVNSEQGIIFAGAATTINGTFLPTFFQQVITCI